MYSVPLGVRHISVKRGKYLDRVELNLVSDYAKTRKYMFGDINIFSY